MLPVWKRIMLRMAVLVWQLPSLTVDLRLPVMSAQGRQSENLWPTSFSHCWCQLLAQLSAAELCCRHIDDMQPATSWTLLNSSDTNDIQKQTNDVSVLAPAVTAVTLPGGRRCGWLSDCGAVHKTSTSRLRVDLNIFQQSPWLLTNHHQVTRVNPRDRVLNVSLNDNWSKSNYIAYQTVVSAQCDLQL